LRDQLKLTGNEEPKFFLELPRSNLAFAAA